MHRLIPPLLLVVTLGAQGGVDGMSIESDLEGKYVLAIVVHD